MGPQVREAVRGFMSAREQVEIRSTQSMLLPAMGAAVHLLIVLTIERLR